MEEYEYSYADNNRAMNYGWAKNFGSMKNLSAHASPKLSARNSYTGDSPDDFNDVFGGPPKYISLKQLKDPRKAHSLLQPTSGFPGLVPSNIPVFGETRRRYVNDEFYDDIFNGDAASNAGDMSDKCSVASRSTSRNPSPAQSPLPSAEYKAFGSISPLAPKPRQNVKSSKQTEFPLFGISSHHGPSKFYNDSSVVSSAQSSPRDHSSDLLEMPFGRCSKPPKALAETRQQGLKKQQEIAVLPPRSSKSRYQPFLEPGESILDTPARLSHDKLYSTAQTTSCSHTSDDELGDNIQGLSRHISGGVCKPDVEKRGPDNARGSNSGEKEEDNGFEKPRSSASSGTSIKHFEKPRSSASSATSIKHQRPAVSHPSDALQLQHQLKSWRDWFQEPKVLGSNQESGSLSMGSSGLSSAREVHANIGTSSVHGVSQEIGSKRFSTTGIDSGEESDDLGSYVIEIDAKRGETIAFLPERDIQIDTSNALNSSISSTKEKIKNAQKESLLHRPVQRTDHDAKGGKFRLQSLSQKKYDFDPLGELEAKMQTLQTNKGKGRSKESSKILSTQHIHERSAWPVPTPAVEQGTKEALIKEAKKEALRDPYSIDPSTMVKEVFNKIEKWHCEQPAVFHEMPQTLERNESADGTTAKETVENRRKRLEKECQLRTKERVSKILVEKKQKELEAEEEQAEKTKTSEKLDSEIKRWSAGKEGNIRALLSTLQYVLWPDSGWRPVPLIEIIEGVAVKKAYQKARLCVHPDKLQQKGATVQQKYIAEKVFNILQEAWTIFNSMDPF